MEKQSNGVQSLEVGLSVLNVLVEAGAALMLKEVAAAADMHPAKAHRYLVSLVKCGYAKQQTDGRYGLGNAALAMGLAATRRSDGLQIAQPCLQQLHQEVGEYLQVARWTPLGPLVVQFLDNEFGIPISAKVGAIMPILRSATGRVFASFLPETMVKPLVEQAAQDHDAEVWQAFQTQKQRIVQQGCCVVEGEMVLGINAIAAPVFDANNDVVFVLTCLGAADKIHVGFDGVQVKAVLQAARTITAQLGQHRS